MSKQTIELKVNDKFDREDIIRALTNSGFKVWVVNVINNRTGGDRLVCFEYDRDAKDEITKD